MALAGISTDNTQLGKKSLKRETPQKKDSPAKSVTKSKAVEEEKKESPKKVVTDQHKNDADQKPKVTSGDGDPLESFETFTDGLGDWKTALSKHFESQTFKSLFKFL